MTDAVLREQRACSPPSFSSVVSIADALVHRELVSRRPARSRRRRRPRPTPGGERGGCAARTRPARRARCRRCSASFSADSPFEIVQSLRSAGFVIRHPIDGVPHRLVADRGPRLRRTSPPRTGARLIDSTPPARMTSASPASIARDPWITASTDEPQSRLTVDAGHARGEAREQRAEPRDVAVVFAGLVRVAEDHVVDAGRVDARCARRSSASRRRRGRRAGRPTGRRRRGRTACGPRRRRRLAVMSVLRSGCWRRVARSRPVSSASDRPCCRRTPRARRSRRPSRRRRRGRCRRG